MAISDRKKVRATLRAKKSKPKTFKTEENAKKWAKEHNVSKYKLVDMRHLGSKDKKIKVVAE